MFLHKSKSLVPLFRGISLAVALSGLSSWSAHAQISNLRTADKDLKLATDSPFRDPDVIYLDADELDNNKKTGVITARGSVEGRYQDKTLQADEVRYFVKDGRVFAIGHVVLVNADGSAQFADKLELSDKLEAGTATNFSARLPNHGQLGAAFAARESKTGIELYNAYYTACEACTKNGKTTKPTWQLKARKVKQNKKTRSIQYRDAVFEFKGIPFFYTPYLSHPDPSVKRASGWLIPFVGISGSKGFNVRTPYYVALDPYSELTITPHVFARVNPLLELQYRRKFYSGELNLEGSFTHASFFDNKGRTLTDDDFFAKPELSLKGKKWRSHFFANGQFDIAQNWLWGFEAGYATDDNYIDRYDLNEARPDIGLYSRDSRRLVEQLYLVGQDDSFRFATSAFGTVSLRTTVRRDENNFNKILVGKENDSTLPVVAPKIELTKYFNDPLVNGRLKVFGDATFLTRAYGTDYIRTTGGLNWQKNFISPIGIEVKPFAMGRYDYFKIQPQNEYMTDAQQESFTFNRTLGQTGIDIRWPFLKPGKNMNWTIEPRVQVTQSFGEGKLANFALTDTRGRAVSLFQDSLDVDLDQALLWNPNKTTGYDLWQKGFRADYGAALTADWGEDNRASLFVGQSYTSSSELNVFSPTSGLGQKKSDIVGQLKINFGKHFTSSTRVRYNTSDDAFRRLDTSFRYSSERFSANARYYRLDSTTAATLTNVDIPAQEISGAVSVKLIDNWSARYTLFRDIDQKTNRRQTLSLIYSDDCTRIEFIYNKNINNLGIVGNSQGFGVRVSLLTLGNFSPE